MNIAVDLFDFTTGELIAGNGNTLLFDKKLLSDIPNESSQKIQINSVRPQKSHISKSYIFNTYLMTDTMHKCIKIGKSCDCNRRCRQLKHNNPSIELMFIIGIDVEKELHDKYSAKRIHGEWFNLTDKDIIDIKRKYKNKLQ